jgi:3-oxoacyl-[acyl-carrier-protein] synthase-3
MSSTTPFIRAISVHFPDRLETNDDLMRENPNWMMDKVAEKTGIYARRISAPNECSSDLACGSAEQLFAATPALREQIDYVLFCSQTPDFILPTTACIIQHRLGLPTTAGALDLNLGCSGFIYGLGLAKGLIESGQARNVLLLTADNYTKLIHPKDRSVRTVFGDAGAATLISAGEHSVTAIHRPSVGSDGSGASNLIVPKGGFRAPVSGALPETEDESGNLRTEANLFMNGREIFAFTIKRVPSSIDQALEIAGWSRDDLDLVIFHQASKLVIDTLTKRLGFPVTKVWAGMDQIGNTVSATIPIALRQALDAGRLKAGDKVLLCGFGVGYSWGSIAVEWVG